MLFFTYYFKRTLWSHFKQTKANQRENPLSPPQQPKKKRKTLNTKIINAYVLLDISDITEAFGKVPSFQSCLLVSKPCWIFPIGSFRSLLHPSATFSGPLPEGWLCGLHQGLPGYPVFTWELSGEALAEREEGRGKLHSWD